MYRTKLNQFEEQAAGRGFPIWKGMVWIGIAALFLAMATRAFKTWNPAKWAGAAASTAVVVVLLVPVFLYWLWASLKPNRSEDRFLAGLIAKTVALIILAIHCYLMFMF
jgi:hypothetical protein